MGSTGSGSFTDYSKRKPSASDINDGGNSGIDNCGKGFNATLEEVSRCFYYINTATVPPPGTEINVFFNGVRISIETTKGEEIGYLPTKYNYLKSCLVDGLTYTGQVVVSSLKSIPSVTVDIVPL